MKEIDRVRELVKLAYQVDVSELDWSMRRLEYFTKELFKYSKFKVGNKVQLASTPIITDKIAAGWMGYKELLVKGRIATIKSVDHYAEKFRYALSFSSDCIGSGTFTFNEEDLEPYYPIEGAYWRFCDYAYPANFTGYCNCGSFKVSDIDIRCAKCGGKLKKV